MPHQTGSVCRWEGLRLIFPPRTAGGSERRKFLSLICCWECPGGVPGRPDSGRQGWRSRSGIPDWGRLHRDDPVSVGRGGACRAAGGLTSTADGGGFRPPALQESAPLGLGWGVVGFLGGEVGVGWSCQACQAWRCRRLGLHLRRRRLRGQASSLVHPPTPHTPTQGQSHRPPTPRLARHARDGNPVPPSRWLAMPSSTATALPCPAFPPLPSPYPVLRRQRSQLGWGRWGVANRPSSRSLAPTS